MAYHQDLKQKTYIIIDNELIFTEIHEEQLLRN